MSQWRKWEKQKYQMNCQRYQQQRRHQQRQRR